MSSPADYLQAAEECRQKAANARSEHERRSYFGMATRWEQMAKNSAELEAERFDDEGERPQRQRRG